MRRRTGRRRNRGKMLRACIACAAATAAAAHAHAHAHAHPYARPPPEPELASPCNFAGSFARGTVGPTQGAATCDGTLCWDVPRLGGWTRWIFGGADCCPTAPSFPFASWIPSFVTERAKAGNAGGKKREKKKKISHGRGPPGDHLHPRHPQGLCSQPGVYHG